MKAMNVSLQNQKRALELKYLISTSDSQNKQQLINVLNKLHPFNLFPLSSAPPLELFQTHQQKLISNTLNSQLQNHSFIIITGGLIIKKGQHTFVQNQYLSSESEEEIIFNIKDEGVELKALPNSCYIKMHNIWINMAKKKQKENTEDLIKQKLLQIPFFANLEFQEFKKICKAAYTMLLGPGDILLKSGDTPYNMYIVVEGELNFQRKIKLVKDKQLWIDVINQLQRKDDDTCQQMFNHLVKNPKPNEQTFEVIFILKSVNQNEIICAKQTLSEQPLTYDIISSLKTKLICLKYPDFYSLSSDRLADIRLWPSFTKDNIQLRKDYYYQMKWQDFKEEAKRQTKLNTLERQKFQDFLRKPVNLSQQKHYYCPHKVGEGNIIDSPASKVSRLKSMTYSQLK